MKYQLTLVFASTAVIGGWLIVMPGSVLTLALRLSEFGEATNTTDYSVILALGWLSLIVSLIACGKLSDALQQRYSTRNYLILATSPLLVIAAVILFSAKTPEVLGAGWILIQVPAAAIVATALATAGDSIPLGKRGLASGFLGAAPIISLLLGTALIRVLQPNVSLALLCAPIVGLLLALPLGIMRKHSSRSSTPNLSPANPSLTSIHNRRWTASWLAFLIAAFLLSWSTSTANGYITLFVEFNSTIVGSKVASSATFLVLIASLAAIAGSLIGGMLSKTRTRSAIVFGTATAFVGIALAIIVMFPNSSGLTIGALTLGVGFGAANGSEFALALSVQRSPEEMGKNLGTLTAITSVPYALVPILATFVLLGTPATGLNILFTGAALTAFVGAAVAFSLRTEHSRLST